MPRMFMAGGIFALATLVAVAVQTGAFAAQGTGASGMRRTRG